MFASYQMEMLESEAADEDDYVEDSEVVAAPAALATAAAASSPSPHAATPSSPSATGTPTRNSSFTASGGNFRSGISPVMKKRYTQLVPQLSKEPVNARLEHVALFINSSFTPQQIERDSYLTHMLPVQPSEVLSCCCDGVLLAKLANLYSPNAVDESLMIIPAGNLAQMRQNLSLLVAASQQRMMSNPRVFPQLNIAGFLQQDSAEAQEFVGNFIFICLFSVMSLGRSPNLLSVLQAEEANDPRAVSPVVLIRRWLEGLLKSSVFNSVDIRPALRGLLELIVQLDLPAEVLPKFSAGVLSQIKNAASLDGTALSQLIIDAFTELRMPCIFTPAHLAAGDAGINLNFLAAAFPIIGFLHEELRLRQLLHSEGVHSSGSKGGESLAVRSMKSWISSLGIQLDGQAYSMDDRDLLAEIKEVDLLQAVVDTVSNPAASRPPVKLVRNTGLVFAKLERANRLIAHCKSALQLKIPEMSGNEIVSGNQSSILALLHALRRHEYERSPVADGDSAPRLASFLERWANQQTQQLKLGLRRRGLGDRALGDAIFLLLLLKTVDASAVDVALVTSGNTPQRRALNAQYLLLALRRLQIGGFDPDEIAECPRNLFEYLFRRLYLVNQSLS